MGASVRRPIFVVTRVSTIVDARGNTHRCADPRERRAAARIETRALHGCLLRCVAHPVSLARHAGASLFSRRFPCWRPPRGRRVLLRRVVQHEHANPRVPREVFETSAGMSYRGTKSTTVNGMECMPWADVFEACTADFDKANKDAVSAYQVEGPEQAFRNGIEKGKEWIISWMGSCTCLPISWAYETSCVRSGSSRTTTPPSATAACPRFERRGNTRNLRHLELWGGKAEGGIHARGGHRGWTILLRQRFRPRRCSLHSRERVVMGSHNNPRRLMSASHPRALRHLGANPTRRRGQR